MKFKSFFTIAFLQMVLLSSCADTSSADKSINNTGPAIAITSISEVVGSWQLVDTRFDDDYKLVPNHIKQYSEINRNTEASILTISAAGEVQSLRLTNYPLGKESSIAGNLAQIAGNQVEFKAASGIASDDCYIKNPVSFKLDDPSTLISSVSRKNNLNNCVVSTATYKKINLSDSSNPITKHEAYINSFNSIRKNTTVLLKNRKWTLEKVVYDHMDSNFAFTKQEVQAASILKYEAPSDCHGTACTYIPNIKTIELVNDTTALINDKFQAEFGAYPNATADNAHFIFKTTNNKILSFDVGASTGIIEFNDKYTMSIKNVVLWGDWGNYLIVIRTNVYKSN